MNEHQLKRVFRGLVSTSILSAVAMTACGGTEVTKGTSPLDGTGGEDGDGAAPKGTGGDDGTGGTRATGGGTSTGGTVGTGGYTSSDGGWVGFTGGATSAGGAVPATGGATGEGGGDPFWPDLPANEFTQVQCTDYQPALAGNLNPASPVDFIGLGVVSSFDSTADAGTVDFYDSTGTGCGEFNDGGCYAALDQAVASLPRTESCGGPPYSCQHFVATTAGDTVKVYTPGAYRDFLGPIDTPQEAILMVATNTFGGYSVNCGGPMVREVEGGYQVVAFQMVKDCAPIQTDRVLFFVAKEGTVTELRRNVANISSACVGRRNEGLVSRVEKTDDTLGDFFAGIAHLEAASVDAFRHLRHELATHGALPELLAAAERAADDEIRHANVMGSLARRFGGEPRSPKVAPLPVRDLTTLACENAVEGCVRETFGALFATYQAASASDQDVARALSEIADDETRHAALAWQIHAWASERLDGASRERIAAARARAIDELRRELDVEVPAVLRSAAGVPARDVALSLLEGLERAIWS